MVGVQGLLQLVGWRWWTLASEPRAVGLFEVLRDLSFCGCNLKCNLRMTRWRPDFLATGGQGPISWLAEVQVKENPTSNTQSPSADSGEGGEELSAVLAGGHGHFWAGRPGLGEELVPTCSSQAPGGSGNCL